jgi:predicted nucleic acid-binding Zn ribbon protein
MQKISDKPLSKHAGCGGRLEKQWSRTGFQFKGSGWYVTDYAGRKSEAKAEGESSGEAKPEGPTEAKETKADAKPESAAAAKKTPKPKSPSKGASTD